jgi:ABC-type antimicrobial peptide transport system permease subunit
VAESENRVSDINITNSGFTWRGKDPNLQEEFASMGVTTDFGKTVNWKIKEVRDFSTDFKSDSSGFIINETAAKFMGFKHPVGEMVQWGKNGKFKIIGVVKDMITRSPYEAVRQTLFYLPRWRHPHHVLIKINPTENMHDALAKIGDIFKKYDPTPFSYTFVDEDYAKKFDNEERIGKLARCFAGLAIFISCLGLFGMASFMAEQRTKEIGVRKVLGATVLGLWGLLSKEFVKLVIISLLIAIPIAWYFMHGWLRNYNYHAELSWWIFAITAAGAIIITLITVSYQGIKAALTNPVKSLKTE